MLQITPQMKILVAVEPADFRKGIDGLARLCKDSLEQDPFGGAVFVFRNRRGTAIKVLVYDSQGFGFVTNDFRKDASAGGHRRQAKTPRRRLWLLINYRSSSRLAIQIARSRRRTGGRSVRAPEVERKTALASRPRFMVHSRQMDRTRGKDSRS